MRRAAGRLSLALALAMVPAPGQNAPEGPPLRITVNLIQVDATVTDSKGHQITDLTADDFEIFEDGRPQTITAFSYVKAAGPQPDRGKPPVRAANPGARPAPALTRQQVRRTIVLMVDDLGLSFESAARVRGALGRFVDEQMQEGDLVAIIRSRGGMGALQQFTSDKRILHAAIDRVRWYPGGATTLAPIGYDGLPGAATGRVAGPAGTGQMGSGRLQPVEEGRDRAFYAGTLGALAFVIRALRDLPGRKAVILFSDGVPLAAGSLGDLTDLANRSAVLVYTIDARALQTLGLTAADNLDDARFGGPAGAAAIAAAGAARQEQFLISQQGLRYLAEETGGFFWHDSNDFNGGIRRALEDLSGYYLIGYKPAESSFEAQSGRRRFHKIEVRVKAPGLHVRSRTGYLGVSDEESKAGQRKGRNPLIEALFSPFDSGDLRLHMTCLLAEAPKRGAAIRTLLRVDGNQLTYTAEPDGRRKVVLDLKAVALGEQGLVAASNDRSYTIRLSPREYQESLAGGFVYRLNVAIGKPGAYQIRAAVRDGVSGKVGSASQFMEVPDVRRRSLALSGVIVNDAASLVAGDGPENGYEIARPGTPALRIFRPGQTVGFGYVIYDARVDPKTGRPRIETQCNLYRDAERIYGGPATPLQTEQQADLDRLVALGTLPAGTMEKPGEYVLQVIVRDKLAPERHQTVAQWIDLEVADGAR